MQPDLEVYDLMLTTCLCEYLAENGQEIKAHNHLVAGLNEARALWYEGAPWAEQLVRLWEVAVTDFRRRHLEGMAACQSVSGFVTGATTSRPVCLTDR